MKKSYLILVIALISCVSFFSCEDDDETINPLVGKWESGATLIPQYNITINQVITLKSDHTGSIIQSGDITGNLTITSWTTSENKLALSVSGTSGGQDVNLSDAVTYELQNDNKTLVLTASMITSGAEMILTRVE